MLLPDNIDFAQSNKYILSIRLLPNGFYFSIHCPSNEEVFYQNNVAFGQNRNYLKSIEKIIFDYSFFSYNYKQIKVISVGNKTTLVPSDLYDKKSENSFMTFNYLNTKSHIIKNEILEANCVAIGDIDKSIYGFLSRALLNPKFINHLSPLIHLFYKLHNKKTAALFVNFNDGKLIDMVAFSKDKLILAKTFYANKPLEDSYYIQKTWESLQLNALSDNLIFSGKTDNHTECINTLKKVVSKTETLSMKLPYVIKTNKEEVPTEILSQLCEL